MISWVRPRDPDPRPWRGAASVERAELARAAGVPKVLICRNTPVLVRLFQPVAPGIIDELPCGRLSTRTARSWEDPKSRAVVERRRMGFAGCAFVAIAMTDKGELRMNPRLISSASPRNAAGEVIDEMVSSGGLYVEGLRGRGAAIANCTQKSVRRAVRAVINEQWGKKPICLVHVLTV